MLHGGTKSCGCLTRINSAKANAYDLHGKTFGELEVLNIAKNHPKDARGGVVWHCKCECGNEVDIPYNWLMYSGMQSCGCQQREHEQSLSTYLTHVNGTSLDMIRSKKVPNDNTTGYRGVYLIKGKYVAKIVFQKKSILPRRMYYGSSDDNSLAAEELRLNQLIAEVMNRAKQSYADSEEFLALSQEIAETKKRIAAKKEQQIAAHANEARMNEVLGTLDVLKNHPIDYDDSVTRKLVDCIKVVSKNELLVIFKGGIEKTVRME